MEDPHKKFLKKEFLKKGFKKIVAIGGDGTIIEVENGFFEVEEKPVNHVNIGNQNNNSNNNAHSAIGSTVVKAVNSGHNVWWINELDLFGIKKSNYGKTESNYIQNLDDLSDDVT